MGPGSVVEFESIEVKELGRADPPSPKLPADGQSVPAQAPSTENSNPLRVFAKRGEERWVISCVASSDGRHLYVGGDRKHIPVQVHTPIRVMDLKTGEELAPLAGNICTITSLVFSEDRRTLASVSGGGPYLKHVRVWNLATRNYVHDIHLPSGIGDTTLAFNRMGELLGCGYDETVRVWDVKTGKETHSIRASAQAQGKRQKSAVKPIAFNRAADRVLSGSQNGTIARWDVKSGADDLEYSGHTKAVTHLAVSEDGALLVSCSQDGSVKVWNLDTAKPLHTFNLPSVPTCAAMSRDNRTLAVGCEDGGIRQIAVPTGRTMATHVGHGQPVTLVLFLPGGDELVSGGQDAVVRVWKLVAPKAAVGQTNSVRLFNGKDLTGWVQPPEHRGKDWVVNKDGELLGEGSGTFAGGPALLATAREDFADFRLKLRVKNTDGQTKQIYIRTGFKDGRMDGYGIAVGGTAVARGNQVPVGSISKAVGRPLQAPVEWSVMADQAALPVGDWYTLEISAVGNRITTTVNGKTVAEYTDPGPVIKAGHIRLIGRSTTSVAYKDIEITELPAGGAP
jgi:hypothetical protein